MKKIAIISDSFPPNPCGGIATSHYNLFKYLKSLGNDVRVFTYLDNQQEIDNNLNIYRFGASKLDFLFLKTSGYLSRKVKKWLFREKKDAGISYQLNIIKHSNIGSKKINKYLIGFKPDYVFIPDFGAPIHSLIKLPYAKYYYISHHNPIRFLDNPLLPLHSRNDAMASIKIEQNALKKIDAVICPSLYMKSVFESTFSYNREILIIPNIIDFKSIEFIKKENLHKIMELDDSYPIVYIPSASSKIKGGKYVLEIIRRISHHLNNKVGFYLSGGVSDIQKFELDALKYIFYYAPGSVTYNENISLIKDCYLCVSPTLLESFGMAIIESMFCGIPTVSFDAGGNKDFIKDDFNGFIVTMLDVEMLILKVFELLDSKSKYALFKNNIETFKCSFMTENDSIGYHNLIQ